MQEVWRCEGDHVSLQIQKDFKRLKGEDYATNICNGRFKPASAKHSSHVKDEFIVFLKKTYKTLSFKLCNAFALYGLGLPGWYGSTTSAAIDVLHKTLGLSVHRYHLGDTADIFSVILSTRISLFVVCSILVSSNLFFIIGARKKVKERYDHKGIAK